MKIYVANTITLPGFSNDLTANKCYNKHFHLFVRNKG